MLRSSTPRSLTLGLFRRAIRSKYDSSGVFRSGFVAELVSRRYYSNQPFKVSSKEFQQQKKLEKIPKYKQWAQYFQSEKFKKSMTVYYIGGFIVVVVAFYFYMRDRYYEDKQINHIRKKYQQDPKSLSEYEYLKLKASSNEKLKPKEQKKYQLYQLMRKEFRRKHILDKDVMFEPTTEEVANWYDKQIKLKVDKEIGQDVRTHPNQESGENVTFTNHDNPHIVSAQDTTDFFEKKALDYDDEIKWEERVMLLGKRRRWLMKQAKGDVLEVSCGTGRNLRYFQPEAVDTITFLDSSQKMVEVIQDKFIKMYPKYHKAAFTVGKAEDLVELTQGNDLIKYDTIIEAFGLCSHQDPVKALKNMTQLLRPGGRIVLLEHGRSNWKFINNHLDFRAEKRMKTWACRWNLDIAELIEDAGLDITFEKRVHFGSTWMLVCKRPEDPIRLEEKPFINKLFGTEFKLIKKE